MGNGLSLFGKGNKLSLKNNSISLKKNGIGVVRKSNAPSILNEAKLREEQRLQALNLLFGIDGTGSTSNVINGFRERVADISKIIEKDYPAANIEYGRFDCKGHRYSSSVELLQEQNVGATSNVPKFINTYFEKNVEKQGTQNLLIVFGDEVFWNSSNNSPSDRSTMAQNIKSSDSTLIFLWENTGMHSFDEVKKMMIDPVGENGYIFDMNNLDMSDLKSIILGCVRHKVSAKTNKTINPGAKQISLKEFFAQNKIGNNSPLRIESGN